MPAYEKIWFFCDEFGFSTFNHHYLLKLDEMMCYTHEIFDVFGFLSSGTDRRDMNTVSRMRNLMVRAILEQKTFPKMIIIVPDADILDYCVLKGVYHQINRVVEWIMRKLSRMVETHKEHLPHHCKKAGYPAFIWIEAPLHDNFTDEANMARSHFNRIVSKAAILQENTWSLQLKKIWDSQNGSLFLKEEQRFTAEGLKYFWEAVDKTVRYADTILLKKATKQKGSNQNQHNKLILDQSSHKSPGNPNVVIHNENHRKSDKFHLYNRSKYSPDHGHDRNSSHHHHRQSDHRDHSRPHHRYSYH